LILNFKVFWHL